MLRALVLFLSVGHAAQAEEVSTPTSVQDEYGCAIIERPSEFTFTTFRDAWRSVAADKLYSIVRHRAVIDGETCGCDVMRPDWSVILQDFQQLGFDDGPRSGYDAWAQAEYFPNIDVLSDAVALQCGGAK